jgi:AcrR family transcriptional regulator
MLVKGSAGRREEILAAGERVIRARGPEGATVDEVAVAAGVAKGTFYLYFHSKGDLLAALRNRFAELVVAAAVVQAEPERSGEWLVRARRLVEVIADTHLENAELYRALFAESSSGGMNGAEGQWSDEIVRLLARFIDAGAAAGAFAVADAEATALLLFHGVHGLLHEALRRPEAFDRPRVLAAADDVVARALTGNSVPAHARGRR